MVVLKRTGPCGGIRRAAPLRCGRCVQSNQLTAVPKELGNLKKLERL